jgi:beta-glucanase (GH16 family)
MGGAYMQFFQFCKSSVLAMLAFCSIAAAVELPMPGSGRTGHEKAVVATGSPVAPTVMIIDDFESGSDSDWESFDGNQAGGGFGVSSDRPREGSYYLSTGWGGQGTVSDYYGGVFRNLDNAAQVALPADPWFSVWVLNQSNATVDQFRLEITLREDLDGNGWTDGQEDSIRLDTTFTSDQFDDEWVQISAPLSSFSNTGTGGDGFFNGALDVVVLVIAGVEGPSGSTVEIDFDRLALSSGAGVCALDGYTVDDFEDGQLPLQYDAFGQVVGFTPFAGSGATVSIETVEQSGNITLSLDSDVPAGSWGGVTRHFGNESLDTWISQDWSAHTTFGFSVFGTGSGSALFLDILDNRSSIESDSPEVWTYEFTDDFTGWQRFEVPFVEFTRKDIGNGAPNDGLGLTQMHGWAFGSLGFSGTLQLDDLQVCGTRPPPPPLAGFQAVNYSVNEGETAVLTVTLNKSPKSPVTIDYATAEATARAGRQYAPVNGSLVFGTGETVQNIEIPTFQDGKHAGDRRLVVNLYANTIETGYQRRTVLTITDLDAPDEALVDDFEEFHPFVHRSQGLELGSLAVSDSEDLAIPYQGAYEDVLSVTFDPSSGPVSFGRRFAARQDWSSTTGLNFWFYGSNSGQPITFVLMDNVAATTAEVAPESWVQVWGDEFNGEAGTPPDVNVWRRELGDGALRGIQGWGGSELQYYTDETANAAMDGNGNLVISIREVDPGTTDLVCWYGPCQYTSARLNSLQRLDFQYGRIEARMLMPDGPGGMVPAFWMLGSNFPEVDWPQSGEIDIMEYVSRLPTEVFGTIHGPGYSGGLSFGDIYDLGTPVSNDYHTYAIEWGPNTITWYIDDIAYHSAVPADVSPNEWVFNQPFFMLLNSAIGGGFGGGVDESMTFPQDMRIDYVRVFQAADTSERFEAVFADNFSGWREITIPFSNFLRSTVQPAGAPDDGLTLREVWGYGFLIPEGTTGEFYLDRVRTGAGNLVFGDGFEAQVPD